MPERSKESVVSKTLFISFHSGNSGLLRQVIGGQVISLLEVLANAVEKKEKARAGWMDGNVDPLHLMPMQWASQCLRGQ